MPLSRNGGAKVRLYLKRNNYFDFFLIQAVSPELCGQFVDNIVDNIGLNMIFFSGKMLAIENYV